MTHVVPKCSAGHSMEATKYQEGGYCRGWLCNACSKTGYGGRWLCPLCCFDLCFECLPRVRGLPAGVGVPAVPPPVVPQLDGCHLHVERIQQLEKRIILLEAENAALRNQQLLVKEQALELTELVRLSERHSIVEHANAEQREKEAIPPPPPEPSALIEENKRLRELLQERDLTNAIKSTMG